MNFRTFENLTDTIYRNMHKIPVGIDLVAGIPRSGLIPGEMIALFRNVPFTDIGGFVDNRPLKAGATRVRAKWAGMPFDAENVLIVDDSISAGNAVKEAKKLVSASGYGGRVTYCAIYADPTAVGKIDIWFEIVSQPRLFEWNYLHHWALEFTCVDIDGVLCRDPSRGQNDDDVRYCEFIDNAAPLFLPTMPVHSLVTSRLEKYRGQTEAWLSKYGVEYRNLVMLEVVTAKERALDGGHGKFKGEYFKNCGDTALFIESNYEQAVQICRYSGKQVFCTQNRELITPENLTAHMQILASDIKLTLKHAARKFLRKA